MYLYMEKVQRLKNNKGEDRMQFCQIKKEDISKNDLVIGSLLGDAHINKDGRIQIFHSIKQKEYTLWLMELFKKLFKVKYMERVCHIKETGREYYQIGFYVSATNYTKLVRQFMYRPNKTIIFKQLNKLTPLGLAIWYLDDGCLSFIKKNGKIKARQIIMNTQSYSYKEQLLICQFFKTMGIECRIHKDKDKFRIWMNGTNGSIFLSIIRPYIPKCMYYKVCYRYFGYNSSKNLCGHSCDGNCPYNII